MTEINYKKATKKDATAISLLWAEHFDYHSSVDPLYKRIKDSEKNLAEFLTKAVSDIDSFIGIAKNNNTLVGFIWCEIDKKPPCFVDRLYGVITDIAVTKEYRRKGIAQELLKQGIEWFESKEIKHIETRILQSNPLASKFWHSSGFEPFMNILCYRINN